MTYSSRRSGGAKPGRAGSNDLSRKLGCASEQAEDAGLYIDDR